MKYLLCLCLLTACGSIAPGFAAGADGGWVDPGTGVAAQGLIVKAGGVDVGVLLDVDEETGVWKVYSDTQRVVFHLDPDTGVVGAIDTSIFYTGLDCTGEAIAKTGSTGCDSSTLGEHGFRKLVVRSGDTLARYMGDRAMVADGPFRSVATLSVARHRNGAPGCINNTEALCGMSAVPLDGLSLRLQAPLTLAR